ncbi:MAG: RNA-binding protein [Caulobacterales bacterium]
MTAKARDGADCILSEDGEPEDKSGRERRCAATGERTSDDRLVRFALDPAGLVTPDIVAKLPGRGVWTLAERAAVEAATAKGGFARGFKRAVSVTPALADRVEALLARRCLDFLGIARGAGELILGSDSVDAAIRKEKPQWLIEASDGAADGRDKLLGLARGMYGPVRVAGCFTAEELGVALGRDRVVHAAIPMGRLAHRWTVDIGRLSGFRAIIPADWRQDIVD